MLYKRNPQLNKNGELIHLLSTEGLSKDILTHILNTAENFVSVNDREVKKVPLLRGKSVFNLFFENSTRTRTTFEIAAKRLSADVFNLDIARSSASKGETLLDTIDKVRERLNFDLELEGILATMYDSRTTHCRQVLQRVVEAFGDKVYQTVITKTVKFPESTVAGAPITTMDPSSSGARNYRQLAREVIAAESER